jgi:hypothetical protein
MAVFTFANQREPNRDIAEFVRALSRRLREKYAGCTADVVRVTDAGSRAAVKLSISPEMDSSECLNWFADELARNSIMLVRDESVERMLRNIRNTG